MLCVAHTSIHCYEYITGTHDSSNGKKGNKGTTMQIRFEKNYHFFPPLKKFFTEEYNLKLRDFNIGFLGTLSSEERLKWVIDYSSEKDLYINEIPGLEVRFISIGGEFSKLPSEFCEKMMQNDWIPIQEVFDNFPKKPGSKSKRHTLIFRPGIWSLIKNPEEEENADLYFDLNSRNFLRNKPESKRIIVVKVKNYTIGICDDQICNKEFKTIIPDLEWLTPGILKSLLQKCIRFYAEEVIINGKNYNTETVIKETFMLLYSNPGSFVPDLKMFVKGSESAFKRLAISLIEDSYTDKITILTLFLASLAARKDFKFSESFLEFCLNIPISSKNFIYEIKHQNEKTYDSIDDYILDSIEELKSFESDLLMIKSCCINQWTFQDNHFERPKVMNVEHCLDHHCTSFVLYLYFLTRNIEYTELVSRFWNESSVFNPRKNNITINSKITRAQFRYLDLKTRKPEIIDDLNNPVISFCKNLDPSWICSMVGKIENKIGNRNLLSFFHPDDISKIVTVRAPSRDKHQEELSDQDLQQVEYYVEDDLSKPFRIKEESLNIDCYFTFKDGEFYIENKRWIDWCNEEIEIPVFEDIDIRIETEDDFDFLLNKITSRMTYGIHKRWKQNLYTFLDSVEKSVLYRICMYLRPEKTIIEMNKISRDGTGTYQTVSWEDHYVFTFLCLCCYLCPFAIQVNSSSLKLDIEFKITNIFFWKEVKELVNNELSSIKLYDWGFRNNDNRDLYDHQQEAVNCILDRIDQKKRGNVIWYPVGSGKTLICISILFELMKRELLPKYVVYSYPSESFSSVSNEFIRSGLPIKVLRGNKNDNDFLEEFTINFIEHDEMRKDKIKSQLVNNANNIFMIFDEMHTMTNLGTQRSSIAIYLSKIVQNFIAMTGTLFRNPDPEGVLEWISQVVKFEIKKEDYMLGVASLISKKIKYGIKEDRIFIDVPSNDQYYEVVSDKLGGKAERTDFRTAVEICYDIVKNEMLNYCLDLLETERHIFVVALNKNMQNWFKEQFENNRYKVFCITSKNTIDLKNKNDLDIDVIITTIRHSAGYNLTGCRVMIQSVYFSNQATRTQLEGRLIRMGQKSNVVKIITFHTGILSYVLKNYENVRSIEQALKDLAKDI